METNLYPDFAEIQKKVRQLYLGAKQKATESWQGVYLSHFSGGGDEIKDIREYQAGDDPRFIDWNVTARLSKPYVRSFQDRRAITIFLLVDISASMSFGSQDKTKNEVAAELAAIFSISAIRQADRIGLVLFSEEVYRYLPPVKSKEQIYHIIQEILSAPNKRENSDVEAALKFLRTKHSKHAICLIISDGMHKACSDRVLQTFGHFYEMHFFCLIDPAEKQIPDVGLLQMQAFNSNEQILIDTKDPQINQRLQKHTEQRLKSYKELLQKHRIGFAEINIEHPIIPAIVRYFSKKKC